MKTKTKVILGVVAAVVLAISPAIAGELVLGIKLEPSSIDPHYHNLGPNNALARHIFGSLVDSDENQRLGPGLAVSWRALNDTTWEFKLRRGVKFHDGTPFTADDVLFTFERAPNVEASPSSFALYTKGKTLKKIDDYTVHIITEKPYPLMPNDVSTIYIISSKHGKGAKTGDYNSGKAAIGTGPYKFSEWVPGDRLVLEKNPGYWGDKAQFDRVVFKPISRPGCVQADQVGSGARRSAAGRRRRDDRRGAHAGHPSAQKEPQRCPFPGGFQSGHLPSSGPIPGRLAVHHRNQRQEPA